MASLCPIDCNTSRRSCRLGRKNVAGYISFIYIYTHTYYFHWSFRTFFVDHMTSRLPLEAHAPIFESRCEISSFQLLADSTAFTCPVAALDTFQPTEMAWHMLLISRLLSTNRWLVPGSTTVVSLRKISNRFFGMGIGGTTIFHQAQTHIQNIAL